MILFTHTATKMQRIRQQGLIGGFVVFSVRGRQNGHAKRGQHLGLPRAWERLKEWVR